MEGLKEQVMLEPGSPWRRVEGIGHLCWEPTVGKGVQVWKARTAGSLPGWVQDPSETTGVPAQPWEVGAEQSLSHQPGEPMMDASFTSTSPSSKLH